MKQTQQKRRRPGATSSSDRFQKTQWAKGKGLTPTKETEGQRGARRPRQPWEQAWEKALLEGPAGQSRKRPERQETHHSRREQKQTQRARKLIQTPTEEFAKQKQRDESPAERETRWGTQLGPETADPGPIPHWQTR